MKRMLCLMLLGAAALTLAGCGRIHHHATFPTNKPIAFGSNIGQARQYVLVRSFDEPERQVYFLFHWLPINHANGVEGAEKHLDEGDAIVNLRIKTKFGPVDYLITLVTGGIITTYTVETHGDIVNLTAPPPRL